MENTINMPKEVIEVQEWMNRIISDVLELREVEQEMKNDEKVL